MLTIADKITYFTFAIWITVLLQLISALQHNKVHFGNRTIDQFLTITSTVLLYASVILFCAFRKIGEGIGGTDANAYMLQFENSTGSIRAQLSRFAGWEPLHAISLWLIRKLTDNYRVFLCIYYFLLTKFLLKYTEKYCLDKKSILSTFAIILFMLNSFNTQRNIFAVFLGLYVIDSLERGNYKKAILLSITATGFHFSGAIYLISIGGFYFLKYVKGKHHVKLTAYVIFSLIVSVLISKLIPRIVGGSRLSIYESGTNVSYAMILAFLFIAAYQYLNRDMIRQKETVQTLSTVYLTFAPMFIFQLFYSILYRFMLYSIPVLYILIWIYKKITAQRKRVEDYLFYIVFDLLLIIRIVPFFTASISDIGPYSSVLFH